MMTRLAFLILLTACTKHNPAVCCETDAECAAVGFEQPAPCEEGVCVLRTCTDQGCDGDEDCHDAAFPTCVAGVCKNVDCQTAGGRILFLSNRDGDDDVYVALADGKDPRPVTFTPTSEVEPQWSPDGARISYRGIAGGKSDVFVMNGDGSHVVNASMDNANEAHVRWSPNNDSLIFDTIPGGNPTQVAVMSVDGSNRHPVTTGANESSDADWFRDGTKIVFRQGLTSGFGITAIGLDGTGTMNLTAPTNGADSSPRVSPDGRKVAYLDATPVGQPADLHVLTVSNGNDLNLTMSAETELDFAWSPDGTKIAFVRETAGNRDIWVVDATGGTAKNLTMHAGTDEHPRWSPDGTAIVFETNRDGNREIYRMSSDGSNPTNLTHDPGSDTSPEWTTCPMQ